MTDKSKPIEIDRDKLKPCPFCGGDADYYTMYGYVDVGCIKCGATIRGNYTNRKDTTKNRQKAVDAWNRRATPPNNPLTVEELKDMVGETIYIENKEYEPIVVDGFDKWTGRIGFTDGGWVDSDDLANGTKLYASKPEGE